MAKTDPLAIDVLWSLRSPWSYLATPRLLDWSRRYALDAATDWREGAHLADAARTAGLDLDELDRIAQRDVDRASSRTD